MNETSQDLVQRIDSERLRDLTLDLVKIPSPTGDEAAAAEYYARVLRDTGLEVEIDDEYPNSPNVIARLRGARPGRTLQFDGHVDTVHTPHDPPCYADGRIYGRGACDMKSGLAAIAEVARVVKESGVRLRGDVLLTAHGLHEAPWGTSEALRLLIHKGQVGDAVIVCEGDPHELPVVGKGMSIFEVDIHREGKAVHEVVATEDLPHPILAGHRLVQALLDKNSEFAQVDLPYVGPETYFIGVFESGDFYNRVPTRCRIVGTRRYAPERTFAGVENEIRGITEQVAAETGAEISVRVRKEGGGFRLDPKTRIVVALQEAYSDLHGRALPLVGTKIVTDACIFIREAGVPAVSYGPGLERAHADVEYIVLEDVVDATEVYLLTILKYLGLAD